MPLEIKSAADIEALLLRLIREGSPEDPNCVVEPQSVPNRDIKGFDSLTALEVLTELEEETGLHVEEDIFFCRYETEEIPIHSGNRLGHME
jgi:acyl carrier protein